MPWEAGRGRPTAGRYRVWAQGGRLVGRGAGLRDPLLPPAVRAREQGGLSAGHPDGRVRGRGWGSSQGSPAALAHGHRCASAAGDYTLPGTLSAGAIDFIRRALAMDSENRPSMSELRSHPWIENHRLLRQSLKPRSNGLATAATMPEAKLSQQVQAPLSPRQPPSEPTLDKSRFRSDRGARLQQQPAAQIQFRVPAASSNGTDLRTGSPSQLSSYGQLFHTHHHHEHPRRDSAPVSFPTAAAAAGPEGPHHHEPGHHARNPSRFGRAQPSSSNNGSLAVSAAVPPPAAAGSIDAFRSKVQRAASAAAGLADLEATGRGTTSTSPHSYHDDAAPLNAPSHGLRPSSNVGATRFDSPGRPKVRGASGGGGRGGRRPTGGVTRGSPLPPCSST